MATENSDRPETRGGGDLDKAVQLHLPELFVDGAAMHGAPGDAAPDMGTDIISKSDLAMMRGRRKKYDRQERNER